MRGWLLAALGCGAPEPPEPAPWWLQDQDGDGVFFITGDCDDARSQGSVYHFASPLDRADAGWSGTDRFQHLGLTLDAGGDTDGDGRAELLIGTRTVHDDVVIH